MEQLINLSQDWWLKDFPKRKVLITLTHASVARIATIRLFIALASIHKLVIHQIDIKIAFLNGELDEEVYMKQPKDFIVKGQDNKVCKLVKSFYGLK